MSVCSYSVKLQLDRHQQLVDSQAGVASLTEGVQADMASNTQRRAAAQPVDNQDSIGTGPSPSRQYDTERDASGSTQQGY